MQKIDLSWINFSDKKPKNFNNLSPHNFDNIKDSISNIIEKSNNNNNNNNTSNQKNINTHNDLLFTGNVFFIEWIYYWIIDKLPPALILEFQKFNEDKNLKYWEEKSISFDKMEKIDDNILMYNNWWSFVIFNSKTEKIIYKSKEWELLLTDIYDKISKTVSIQKPYWFNLERFTSELNLGTWEEKFQKYEDKFEIWLFSHFNKFLPYKLKEFKWKLVLPRFNSIDTFLDSPFFWDVVSLALGENKYRRKTFSDCLKEDCFINIYKSDWDIFVDLSEKIINNIFLSFIEDCFDSTEELTKNQEIILKKLSDISDVIVWRLKENGILENK